MKHVQFFNDFLNEYVNLDQSRLKRLNGHVDAVQRFLCRNLDPYQKIERQGSYALGTTIKPVRDDQEYDADILLFMDFDSAKEPRNYIKDLYDCLIANATYADKVHRHARCVELDYAGDFHLDIVPCIDDLYGKQHICNYTANEFEPSDGTGYRDWFNENSKITGGNLKRVTRLLKYLRDHKRTFAVKSILLTTLIGNTVYGESDSENFRTVPDALKIVSNRVNAFLQSNFIMPAIENPALPGEDFTRHWSQSNYDNFRSLFDLYNDKINTAFDTQDHDESVDNWRELFGDGFGSKRTHTARDVPDKGRASISVAPRKPWAR